MLPITEVVVHPDGARVTRAGSAPVVDGRITVRRLPLALDPTSVRVSLGGAPLGQVRLELDLEGVDRGERPEAIEAWTRAREALERCVVAIEAGSDERDVLASLGPTHPEVSERAPSPDRWRRWGAVDAAIDARVAALDTEIHRRERERATLTEQVEILARAATEASGEGWWRRWLPTRRLVVATAGDRAEVTLSYRVDAASWSPSYTLDADGALRGGRFAMRAAVVQHTGEDWSGVELTLTSVPSRRTVDVPELSALRLGKASKRAAPAWRPLPADLESLFADGAAPERPPPPPPSPPPPDLELLAAPMPAREQVPPPRSATRAAVVPADALAAPAAKARAPGAPAPSSPPASRPPPPPPQWEPADRLLDYGRLRMAGGDAGPGARGRLQHVDELSVDPGELGDAAAPANRRLAEAHEQGRRAAAQIARRTLPPRHVLPAPIGGSDVSVSASGRVDVASDGRPHHVAVCTWPIELEVAYRAVPRAQPRVFREVTATVPYDRPLLPGPVEVYVDGRLEVTTPWAGSPGRGRLKIGLGTEDRLKIVRNVRYREETAGLFGGSRRTHTAIEVRIASSLPRPVTVELLERVPVAGDDAVVVEVRDCIPAAFEYKGEPDGPILAGGRVQRLEVGPGAESRAELAYAVTVGSKDELVGGDRRG